LQNTKATFQRSVVQHINDSMTLILYMCKQVPCVILIVTMKDN